jgi:hypothetical protein
MVVRPTLSMRFIGLYAILVPPEIFICNAFNHPPNCECGWGGVWYGATADRATWLFDRPAHHPRQLGRQSGTFQPISRGDTRPNTVCPVCGEPVYFYVSPYGGRVFFDDLGPPWPKQPCTDHSQARSRKSLQRRNANGALAWRGDVQSQKQARGCMRCRALAAPNGTSSILQRTSW